MLEAMRAEDPKRTKRRLRLSRY